MQHSRISFHHVMNSIRETVSENASSSCDGGESAMPVGASSDNMETEDQLLECVAIITKTLQEFE